jgi:hypothetical protein
MQQIMRSFDMEDALEDFKRFIKELGLCPCVATGTQISFINIKLYLTTRIMPVRCYGQKKLLVHKKCSISSHEMEFLSSMLLGTTHRFCVFHNYIFYFQDHSQLCFSQQNFLSR